MTVVFLTAVPLAIFRADVFLLLIAVFSFYLVLAGWRFAVNHSGQPQTVDWACPASACWSTVPSCWEKATANG